MTDRELMQMALDALEAPIVGVKHLVLVAVQPAVRFAGNTQTKVNGIKKQSKNGTPAQSVNGLG